MTYLNAYDIDDYERFEICGEDALFTNARIDPDSVPEGFHRYELRGDDYGGSDICEIAKSILVNHFGTVITRNPIELLDGESRVITDDDYNFIGDHIDFESWMNGDYDEDM